MIDAIADLWSMMTIFFTLDVIENVLFQGMMVFSGIIAAIFIFMKLFQRDTWRW